MQRVHLGQSLWVDVEVAGAAILMKKQTLVLDRMPPVLG